MAHFQISGKPVGASLPESARESPRQIGLIVGLGVSAVALLGAGVWWYRRRALAQDGQAENEEDLLSALADLDDRFEAGEVERRAYERSRARLKAKLVKEWKAG